MVRTVRFLFPALLSLSLFGRNPIPPPATREAVYFEQNLGQADKSYQFIAGSSRMLTLFSGNQVIFRLGSADGRSASYVRMRVENANQKAVFEAERPLPGVSAYFVGGRPQLASVPHFGAIRAKGILPGIDLLFYAKGSSIEYDFTLAPGADANSIKLRFDGASNLRVNGAGDLILTGNAGELMHRAPHAFASRRIVEARYALVGDGHTVRIETAAYDKAASLTIDPVITYSTFLGGPTKDTIVDAATDAAGSAYILGATARTGYLRSIPPLYSLPYGPRVTNDYESQPFLAKFSFDGSGIGTLEYLTYVNGSSIDRAETLAVTSAGVAYLAGATASADLPTVKPIQGPSQAVRSNPLIYGRDVPGGGNLYTDGFIIGLEFNAANHSLSIPFATYLSGGVQGGVSSASIADIAAGPSGSIYFVGTMNGATLVNPSDTCCGNMLVQLKRSTAQGNPWEIVYSTVLGSFGAFVGVDANEDVYTAGYTPANQELEVTKYRPSTFQRIARSTFPTNASQPLSYALDPAGILYSLHQPFGVQPQSLHLRKATPSGASFTGTLFSVPGTLVLIDRVRLAVDSNRDLFAGFSAFAGQGPNPAQTPIPGVGEMDNSASTGAVIYKILTGGGTSMTFGSSSLLGHGTVRAMAAGPGDALIVAGTPFTPKPVPLVNATLASPLLTDDVYVTRLAFSQSQADAGLRVTKFGRGTVASTGGQINCGSTCATSATGQITLVATPDSGWTLQTWEGACTGSGSCSVTVDSLKGVTAVFERRIRLTIIKSGAGSGTVTIDNTETCGPTCTVFRAANTGVNMKAQADAGSVFVGWSAYCDGADCGFSPTSDSSITAVFNRIVNPVPTGWKFVPMEPCRIFDSRLETPQITALVTRDVPVRGRCGVPNEAAAFALNLTVVPLPTLGYITMWPTGQPRPNVSTLNSLDGRVKANFAIVNAGTSGAVSLFANSNTDAILDISGYFVPLGTQYGGTTFYPIAPCRIIDTRDPSGLLGGPRLAAQQTRVIPARMASCGIPEGAVSYSVNATVLPATTLAYLTLWPSGNNQPTVSTLNALTGTIVANAAILRGSTDLGHFSTFVTHDTDLIVDINGYFAPGTAPGGLFYYPLTPCRVFDTRSPSGTFGGPIQTGEREYPVRASSCGVPTSAQAYAVNATVIPETTLGYLALWPSGSARPTVSTLNAVDGALTSNAAIVPAGPNGNISTFMNGTSHLFLDISGYFAP